MADRNKRQEAATATAAVQAAAETTVATSAPTAVDPTAEVVTFSTGVRLRLLVPSFFIMTAMERQLTDRAPKPPLRFNPDKEREEPDEADPAYVAAVAAQQGLLMERYADMMFMYAKLEFVPDDVPVLESDGWIDQLALLGIAVRSENSSLRQIDWCKYVAAPRLLDLARVLAPMYHAVGNPPAEAVALAQQAQPAA